jgi:hypothetical protein
VIASRFLEKFRPGALVVNNSLNLRFRALRTGHWVRMQSPVFALGNWRWPNNAWLDSWRPELLSIIGEI